VYRIKDIHKLIAVADALGIATTVEEDGRRLDRDTDEIAREVAEKAMNEWGKSCGELLYLKRAPEPLYHKWKNQGVLPRNAAQRGAFDRGQRTHQERRDRPYHRM
jgi:anaerobic carbon-monoxide dehydrogenase catalytic subunit